MNLFKYKLSWIILLVFFLCIASCSPREKKIDNTYIRQLDQTTLTIWFPGSEPKGMREVLDKAEKMCAAELNVMLDFQFFPEWENYYQQIKGVISSGHPCDAFLYLDDTKNTLEEFVRDEIAADITDIFPKYASEIYLQSKEEIIKYLMVNNRLYGIPRIFTFPQRLGAIVRDDLLKKYGFTSINDYDQLEAFLKEVKQGEPDIFPMTTYNTSIGLFANTYGYVILDYEVGLVYRWDDQDMILYAWEQTPEFKEAEKRLAYWYREGYIKPGHNANNGDLISKTGKWAVILNTMGNSLNINIQAGIQDESDFAYREFPLYPEKKAPRASPLSYALIVSKQSKNKERVLMFLNWIQSQRENYRLLRYGISGRDYNIINESITVPDSVKSVDELFASWIGASAWFNINYEGPYWFGGNYFDMKEYWHQIVDNTAYVPHSGFEPDYTSVQSIRSLRRSSFTSLVIKMERGIFQDKDLDDYINQMKRSGTDELVRAIQQQLDQWNEHN